MNANDRIKNLPSFKKCNNLVNQYALALGRVQEKVNYFGIFLFDPNIGHITLI
jgi:hypothetical protein